MWSAIDDGWPRSIGQMAIDRLGQVAMSASQGETMSAKPSTDIVNAVIETITKGMANIHANIQTMAAACHSALRDNPGIAAIIIERHPEIPMGFLRKLDKIGAGQLDHRILLGVPFGSVLERMPISEQRKAIDSGMELLTANGDTLRVKVSTIDRSQADQIFAVDHIRTPEEQRAHIESGRTMAKMISQAKRSVSVAWEINKRTRKVVVLGPCEFGIADLADMMRKIAE